MTSQSLSRGRLFYGWWVTLACCLILSVGVGIGFYGPAVFLVALHEREGWSLGAISLATTGYFVVGGLSCLVVGPWMDRYGPRWLLIGGALLMATALVLLGRITALWQLFGVYLLLLAPASAGLGDIPVTVLLTRWFVRRRALALSIAMSGISLGGMVLVPLSVAIIRRWGVGVATTVLAGLVLVVAVPVTVLLIRPSPTAMGLLPDGTPASTPVSAMRAPPGRRAPVRDWTLATAVRTRTFWLLIVTFTLGLGATQAFLVHQLALLGDVIGPTAASTMLSVTAGASIVGRLALGTVSDRLDKRWLAAGCFAAQGLGMLLVLHTAALPLMFLAMLAIGLTMGNSHVMFSLLAAESFAGAAFGAIFGLVTVVVLTGSAFGPWLAGALADSSGGYLLPFTIGSATSVAMAGLVLAVRPPRLAVGERHEREARAAP